MNLSIYIDGEYYGQAKASAKQVATHDDERDHDARKALARFTTMLPIVLAQKIMAGTITGTISLATRRNIRRTTQAD